jgi:hypothetical protein
MLTRKLSASSARSMVDGDELKLANSGEHLRKGIAKS